METTLLVLEDGRSFEGKSFGAKGTAIGEAVFNTSMAGYQEILTDPSYAGQIITMTYPLIGNYGIAPEDHESMKPYLSGLIVKEPSHTVSNWRSEQSLDLFLDTHNIVGLYDIDTRALTRHLRSKGSMRCIIGEKQVGYDTLLNQVKASPVMSGLDLASRVTTKHSYKWERASVDLGDKDPILDRAFHVVVYDFGVKRGILRSLVDVGAIVTVVPAQTSHEDVIALKPDGILLSNGPGDPEPVTYAVDNIRNLLGRIPIFGICLGYQLLALACGAKTYKMKYGHRGANHPVKDLKTQKVDITSHNHGFAVDVDTLPNEIEVTHIDLNDQTLEGFEVKDQNAFGVQFHPEASPGPLDASYLFKQFAKRCRKRGKQ